jgi:CheY-like chemotaxis protein
MESFKQGRQDADRYTDHLELTRRDGSTVWVEFVARYVVNEDSGHVEAYGVSRDITERRQAEAERQRLWAELSQAQKMESIGRLAGGIAHDFNNILADITAQAGLATLRHPALKAVFDELRTDVELGATLIRQLLVFSRRSAIDMRLLDLNEVAGNLVKMLGRLLGEGIGLQFDRGPGQAAVHADAGRLEQVIMNLAVNARDAMPDGDGHAAHRVPRDRRGRGQGGNSGPSGPVLCLRSPTPVRHERGNARARVRTVLHDGEPDKGTGLGLSMVHGIVVQHGVGRGGQHAGQGHHVPDLPASSRHRGAAPRNEGRSTVWPGRTILLVDDFARLREIIGESLRILGYEVMEAGGAEDAMQQWQEHRGKVDLLFTDIALQGRMNGLRLADRLLESKPALKVILSSGYGEELVDPARVAAGMVYLHKPCDPETIARTIRKCFAPTGTRRPMEAA